MNLYERALTTTLTLGVFASEAPLWRHSVAKTQDFPPEHEDGDGSVVVSSAVPWYPGEEWCTQMVVMMIVIIITITIIVIMITLVKPNTDVKTQPFWDGLHYQILLLMVVFHFLC